MNLIRMDLVKTIEEQLRIHWWVEILTDRPCCTYYFGPFGSVCDAILAKAGYLEDLVQEEAEEISVQIKWCRPRELTIFEDVATEGEPPQLCPNDSEKLVRTGLSK